MQVTNGNQTGLTAEMKIIPQWAWTLAVVGFACMQFVFNVVVARDANAPPAWARTLLGLLVGVVLGCYLLLVGYVNRDAGRRGMNRVLWTIVAVLVANGLGMILYFILRQPLRSACPQCSNPIQTGFNFCPRCNYKLTPNCPQCQHVVSPNDVYCPYCGTSLHTPTTPAAGTLNA